MKNYHCNNKNTVLKILYLILVLQNHLFASECNDSKALLDSLMPIQETISQIMQRESLAALDEDYTLAPSLKVTLLSESGKAIYNDEIVNNQIEKQQEKEQELIIDVRSPQTVSSVNFTSITLSDTFSLPPDSNGAAGPSQYLTVVNGRIRSHSKANGVFDGILNASLDAFFESVRNGFGTTDPRVKYDRLNNRWFVICINKQPVPNRLLLAVSNSGVLTAGTVWTFYGLDHSQINPVGDTNLFFDFPTLGIDDHALYIGGNLFTAADAFANTSAIVIQKSSLLSGGPVVATAFRNLINTNGPVTPQGVTNFDLNPTNGFFVGNFNNNFLAMRIISNPASATPSISGAILIPIQAMVEPPDVPANGSAWPLDSVSGRLAEAHIRNNQLWLVHNIGVNESGISSGTISRVGCRWYQFNLATPTSPALVQSGTLFDTAPTNPTYYWMPSIMSSGQNHVALGFSVAGATQFANAGTVGRLSNSPLVTLGTPVLLTNSTSTYNVQFGGTQRWGDYSITSLDPQDNMTFWTIQEFCASTDNYGCQVAKLLAPPPANVSSATPPLVFVGQPSVNVTINGSSLSGSGFYDPGAGFERRIRAVVSGGVIVNSVTYINPMSVTLNIDTRFAPPGVKTVAILNPDGQVTSGSVLFVR